MSLHRVHLYKNKKTAHLWNCITCKLRVCIRKDEIQSAAVVLLSSTNWRKWNVAPFSLNLSSQGKALLSCNFSKFSRCPAEIDRWGMAPFWITGISFVLTPKPLAREVYWLQRPMEFPLRTLFKTSLGGASWNRSELDLRNGPSSLRPRRAGELLHMWVPIWT